MNLHSIAQRLPASRRRRRTATVRTRSRRWRPARIGIYAFLFGPRCSSCCRCTS
jgi:hypothetical protein